MGRKAEIYHNYCQEVTNRTETEILELPVTSDLNKEVSASERISGISHTYTSGRFDGTYKLADGRVVERYNPQFMGGYLTFIVWESKEAWEAHKEPLPYNLYW